VEVRRRWDAAGYHGASDVQEARAGVLLDRLDLRGDETVLDAGCGSGRTTLRLLERLPDGYVIAVDSSQAMIEHARDLLGDRATFIHTDLTELALDREADAVFSNAVFHWVHDQDRLHERLHSALRPGGMLVASCGAVGNLDRFLAVAAKVADEPPYAEHLTDYRPGWRFLEPVETEAALRRAGFTDVAAEVDAIDQGPEDPAGYARTAPLLCYLELLPEDLHDRFVDEVVERCGKPFVVDHVRIRMEGRRPAE
jgi:trans-aconitate 2-methyltransferase